MDQEGVMDQYFVFMTLSRVDAQTLRDLPGILAEAIAAATGTANVSIDTAAPRAMFGGPFDLVVDCRAATFEDAAYLATVLAGTGYVRTTTVRAYSLEDYGRVVIRSKMAP